MTAIGIDLGTTYSAVAVVGANQVPEILENSEVEHTTPSVIYFPEMGDPIVGKDAVAMQSLYSDDTASFFKCFMGDRNFFRTFHGRRYTSTDLSAILLRKLKVDAEQTLGETVREAVITVPAYFNDLQRTATIEAAKQADLAVLRIINEPTAAILAYGNRARTLPGNGPILVYDLGGGTFDISIAQVKENEIRILATGGDHRLGGWNWDQQIQKYISSQFRLEFGYDPCEDSGTAMDLLVRSERAKRELSRLQKTNISLTYRGESSFFTLTREVFEQMTTDLLERTRRLTENVFDEMRPPLPWSDLAGVLLVGGSSRMPMVENLLRQLTQKEPLRGVNRDEVVACGAAIQAVMDQNSHIMLEGGHSSTGFSLEAGRAIHDVTSHSLGMIAEKSGDRSRYVNSIIIPKNSPTREDYNRSFTLQVGAEGGELEVYMLQGENERPLDCAILGKYVFSGIRQESQPQVTIDITYTYNHNGVIQVSAIQRSTRQNLSLRIDPIPEDMQWTDEKPTDLQTGTHTNVAVVLMVDTSGSMFNPHHPKDSRIAKAEVAAREFVSQMDFNHFSVGIGVFGDCTKILVDLSKDVRQLNWTIHRLHEERLGGNMSIPIESAQEILREFDGRRYILLLTDGRWVHSKKRYGMRTTARMKESKLSPSVLVRRI